ncbi:hypothetical protein CCACVL1_19166 [Corchorus capsularis]|uniref:Uncharacterized protein n=1 Tax=Corchorus capsularis TaxID=210143 RepID=A0A1R3HI03_COCAP|nr:hypothetical protein CCACVL1_19166 [Corchorus capsularis]
MGKHAGFFLQSARADLITMCKKNFSRGERNHEELFAKTED